MNPARRGPGARTRLEGGTTVTPRQSGIALLLTALAEAAREELGDYDRIGRGVRFFEDGPRWPRRREWLARE